MESKSEEAIREKLTMAWKFLYKRGFLEGFGHISARLSFQEEILMTPHLLGSVVSPKDFLRVDLDGNVISGAGTVPGEFAIHSEIYKQRSDVGSILHYHGLYSTSFTTSSRDLKPSFFFGSIFRDGIPVHDDSRLINTAERGAALAKTLASHRVVLQKAHGGVATGRDVEEMVAVAFLFEDNAFRTWIGASMGEIEYLCDLAMAEIDRELLASRGPFRRIWALCVSEAQGSLH